MKPDSGYELDELTVTDAKGKEVKVTKRSETTYTFQMPDSKVTVEAVFAKDGTVVEQPLFSDVSKNDYFHDAVEGAVDKASLPAPEPTPSAPTPPAPAARWSPSWAGRLSPRPRVRRTPSRM